MVAAVFQLVNSKSLRPLTVTVTKTLILSLFLNYFDIRRSFDCCPQRSTCSQLLHSFSKTQMIKQVFDWQVSADQYFAVRTSSGPAVERNWFTANNEVSEQAEQQTGGRRGRWGTSGLAVHCCELAHTRTHARTARRLSSDSRDRGADNHLTTINHESTWCNYSNFSWTQS